MGGKFLIFISLIFLLSSCSLLNGKLSGVITYYFNDNYGDKADVGSEIYVLKKSDFNKGNAFGYIEIDIIVAKMKQYAAKDNAKFYAERNKISFSDAQDVYEKAEKDFYNSSLEILKTLQAFKSNEKTKKIVADGNGSYNISIPYGEYYVLVISNHRKASNIIENEGRIKVSKITIKFREETSLNFRFDVGDKEAPSL